MDFGILLSAIAAIITTAEGYCFSTYLYAETYSKSKSVYTSALDYCSIYIRPSTSYSYSSYYLEISWSSFFDVKGNMPLCKEDYVQVFLTGSYRSVGKFCSNNAGKPFTMYSRDRYAKIVYSTDGHVTGSGFKFYYRLRYKSSYPLGGSTSSSTCYNTNNYADSGEIYSTGWPSNYRQSYSSCIFKISKSAVYQGVYVVFMDVDMYNTYSYKDGVQLFASNISTSSYQRTVSSKLYNMYMIAYTTYSNYLTIQFDRRYRSYSAYSYRGFVAGYIMFKEPTAISDDAKKAASAAGIVLGILIPIIIIVLIVIAVVVYMKKKKKIAARPMHNDQTQNATVVSTVQHTSVQQMPQATSTVTYSNYPNPQYMQPASTMQSGPYTQASYPVAYGTGPPYATAQFTTSSTAPPQSSFMAAPAYDSYPGGAVQLPPASGNETQKPSATLHHPPSPSSSSSSSSSDGKATPIMPPIEPPPNVPPPAYHAGHSS